MQRDFWQAPGNGKGFDSYLGDDSKMNNRTIGVMQYIRDKIIEKGFATEEEFKSDIKSYLLDNFHENPNESLDTHFYKPLLFYGFINRNENYHLSISVEGNHFLTSYKENDFVECKKLIINQLDNTTYPNTATKKIRELKLFPFRILFKLLLEQKVLPVSFISEKLVHINSSSDLETYKKTQDLENIKYYEVDSEKFKKFNTWVINSLVSLRILDLESGFLSLNQDILKHADMLYSTISFEDMFFQYDTEDLNERVANKRVKRDVKLIKLAKQRDNYRCVLNSNHKTFKANNFDYVEGHHVIPMFQQKNFPFKLDDIRNIISLCPTCHMEIHHSDDNKTILEKVFTINEEYMKENSVTLGELEKMYIRT